MNRPEIIIQGPLYTCEKCKSLIKVPDDAWKRRSIMEIVSTYGNRQHYEGTIKTGVECPSCENFIIKHE